MYGHNTISVITRQHGVLCEIKRWRFVALLEQKLNQLFQENVMSALSLSY